MFYVFPMFGSGWDWFPTCRIFNFALGIYLIRKGLFPKAGSNRTFAFLSTMSFYVYLVHFPIMCATNYENVGIFYFLADTAVFSFLLYLFDNAVKRRLLAPKVSKVVAGNPPEG
jgi:peptidoglycan/LPS O-acetylase OafA/YrhL